jgi:drug/metabolite transporter (DMT)-like permease
MKASFPLLIVINGIASVGLSVINKSISMSIDAPFSVVGIQNICAVICTIFLVYMKPDLVQPFRLVHLKYFLPITTLFVLALWTSLLSLKYVPLPIYAIAGYTRPICSCIFEYMLSGTTIKRDRLIGLFLIIGGSIIASGTLKSSEMRGFLLALMNTVIVSFLSVVENRTMKKIGNQQTPMGVNLCRLILSLPILAVLAYLTNETVDPSRLDSSSQTLLALSGIICLFSGIVMYALQAISTSTTLLVANAGYKFATSVASVFVHAYWPPLRVVVGYLVSTGGFLAYSLA